MVWKAAINIVMRNSLAWLPIASGALVLVLSLGLALLTVTTGGRGQNSGGGQNTTAKAQEAVPTISLTPREGSYDFSAGQSYPVGIVVDSGGKSIDGVDVEISFDPTRVQVTGGKVNPTTLFSEVPLNSVDNVKGMIKFSALTFEPKAVAGVVGTFSFVPKIKGEVNFAFVFVPGATTDSNMAEHGSAVDVLGKVESATYSFK